MPTPSQNKLTFDTLARVLDNNIGSGKTLGTVEVANATHRSDQTIRNYCSGTTPPDLEWLVTFVSVYRERFPSITTEVLQVFEPVFGGAFEASASITCDPPMRISIDLTERTAAYSRELLAALADNRISQEEANTLGRIHSEMATMTAQLRRVTRAKATA